MSLSMARNAVLGALTHALVVSALTLTAGPALAQSEPEAMHTDAEARSLFEAGREAFLRGRFEAALEYFERSWELSGRPQLLYNIGNAADRLGRSGRALEAFEQYLREVPDARNRGEVESRIAALRAEVPAEAHSETPPAPPPESLSIEPWWMWGVAIGSGVIAITGSILLGLGEADRATVESASPGTQWTDVESAYDRAATLQNVGWTLLAIGVAGAATGITLALVSSEGEASPRITLRIGPGALALGVAGAATGITLALVSSEGEPSQRVTLRVGPGALAIGGVW